LGVSAERHPPFLARVGFAVGDGDRVRVIENHDRISKRTPCFRKFCLAFAGSQTIPTGAVYICMHKESKGGALLRGIQPTENILILYLSRRAPPTG